MHQGAAPHLGRDALGDALEHVVGGEVAREGRVLVAVEDEAVELRAALRQLRRRAPDDRRRAVAAVGRRTK